MATTERPPADPAADATDHVDHLLAQWAVEQPELDTSMLRIGARVVRLARYLDRQIADSLAPWELSEGELNVLAALRRAGPPYELTPTQLYRALLVSSGAMTNRLDRLEEAGLLVRTPDPDDRRRTRVGITDRGRALVETALEAHNTALGAIFEVLGPDESERFVALLRTVLRGLEERDSEA